MKRLIPVCSLILAGLILSTVAASACTYQCVKVAEPFCRRCLDTGEFTGVTCRNSGSCGCFFTVNDCGLAVAGIEAQTGLAALMAPAVQSPLCPARTAGEILPDALLQ